MDTATENYQGVLCLRKNYFFLAYNKELQSAATHLKGYFKKCYWLAKSPPPAQCSLLSSADY